MKKPLIFITNDDSVYAKGIQSLIECLRPLGDILVVAPDNPRSAQSSALTVASPLRLSKIEEEDGLQIYRCNGTPTDCVKLAMSQLVARKPDLLVSGINHGTNASVSIMYSGTMGAALEGCIAGIPSFGVSLCDYSPRADFLQSMKYTYIIAKNILQKGLPKGICLNVNVPAISDIKGVLVCRQAEGLWKEEFVKREDPNGKHYYWLTGYFHNAEPQSDDTDEWALAAGYVSVVPCKIDMTAHEFICDLKQWNYDLE